MTTQCMRIRSSPCASMQCLQLDSSLLILLSHRSLNSRPSHIGDSTSEVQLGLFGLPVGPAASSSHCINLTSAQGRNAQVCSLLCLHFHFRKLNGVFCHARLDFRLHGITPLRQTWNSHAPKLRDGTSYLRHVFGPCTRAVPEVEQPKARTHVSLSLYHTSPSPVHPHMRL